MYADRVAASSLTRRENLLVVASALAETEISVGF